MRSLDGDMIGYPSIDETEDQEWSLRKTNEVILTAKQNEPTIEFASLELRNLAMSLLVVHVESFRILHDLATKERIK